MCGWNQKALLFWPSGAGDNNTSVTGPPTCRSILDQDFIPFPTSTFFSFLTPPPLLSSDVLLGRLSSFRSAVFTGEVVSCLGSLQLQQTRFKWKWRQQLPPAAAAGHWTSVIISCPQVEQHLSWGRYSHMSSYYLIITSIFNVRLSSPHCSHDVLHSHLQLDYVLLFEAPCTRRPAVDACVGFCLEQSESLQQHWTHVSAGVLLEVIVQVVWHEVSEGFTCSRLRSGAEWWAAEGGFSRNHVVQKIAIL